MHSVLDPSNLMAPISYRKAFPTEALTKRPKAKFFAIEMDKTNT